MKTFRVVLVLLIILLLAFLAVVSLGVSANAQEIQAVQISTQSLPELIRQSLISSVGPLYYIIVHYVVLAINNNTIVIRSISLLFYALTIILLYGTLKELANTQLATVGALFFAVSPFIFQFNHLIGPFMLTAFLILANHYFFLRMFRNCDGKGTIGYIITAVLATYTNYFFILIFISQIIYLFARRLYCGNITMQNNGAKTVSPVLKYLVAILAVIALSAPLFLFMQQNGILPKPTIILPNANNVIMIFFNFIVGLQNLIPIPFLLSLWPLWGMLLFFAFATGKRMELQNSDYFLAMTAIPLIITSVFSFPISLYSPENVMQLSTGFIILVALALLRGSKVVSYTLVVIIFLIMFSFLAIQFRQSIDGLAATRVSPLSPSEILLVDKN